MKKEALRRIPSVDSLLGTEALKKAAEAFGREAVVRAARACLEETRQFILAGDSLPDDKAEALRLLGGRIATRLESQAEPSLRSCINATGVIIHTGLGRAVLSDEARQAVSDILRGYSMLAVDPDTGRRGDRDDHLSGLICGLTGAEAATVVNNNAAATVLILNTLAQGKEVIISRGQLVEIGGSFRMPDVMETSGAILREVGTTNKTHLKDYAAAVNEKTGAILRVHHSNYRIVGFAEEPGLEALVELGQSRSIPVIDDLGSGALVDLAQFGLESEPLVKKSIASGASLVCFSGDKLIGGPQSGIIAGRSELIVKIKKNPLKRAFRCGKMTIAALEATLRLFINPDKLAERHPVYRMLALKPDELKKRASRLKNRLKQRLPEGTSIRTLEGGSEVGSGSVPAQTLPTILLSIKAQRLSAEDLARQLRLSRPPVFTRILKDEVVFDLRTILPGEDEAVEHALVRILNRTQEEIEGSP